MLMRRTRMVVLLLLVVLTGCNPPSTEPEALRVRLFMDGQQITLSTTDPLTVGQLLTRNNIKLGELDRIDPADFTLVSDNMSITIVRVRDETECKNQEVAYETQQINVQELKPDETRVLQAGIAGEAKVCFRVVYEDNVEKSRSQSSYTLLKPAQPQLIAVGVDNTQLEPFQFSGTLVYLSNGQAYTIEGNTIQQGALKTGGNLDGKVFSVSSDGRQLLFTRRAEQSDQQGTSSICKEANELWVLLDIRDTDAEPIKIGKIFNVLTADWIPGQPFAFSYSTFTPRPDVPCFTALNDLILARIDSRTADVVAAEPAVAGKPGGVYGAWGTNFAWSPDGSKLAWAQAEGMGVVDLQNGDYVRLLSFPAYTTTLTLGWLWKPSVSWSPDGSLITAAVHGAPLSAGDPADTSPVFNVAVVQASNQYQINPAFTQSGMWAAPRFSPLLQSGSTLSGFQAFLKARAPLNSSSSEYDLVITDRDGSNPQVLFPGEGREGLRPNNDRSDFAWGTDGRNLLVAVVYQGDIYLINVTSGRAIRATLVGSATLPRWRW